MYTSHASCFTPLLKHLVEQVDCHPRVEALVFPHLWRVGFIATRLADAVGFHDPELHKSAFLHDIGKLAIAESILFKPEALTQFEYELIKGHAHIGSSVARSMFRLGPEARYIHDHHERWDGKGYPAGLPSDSTSLGGRIIAVVDAFDAMVFENRPYAGKRSPEEGLRVLNEGAWTQWDGHLVQAFTGLWGTGELSTEVVAQFNDMMGDALREMVPALADEASKNAAS